MQEFYTESLSFDWKATNCGEKPIELCRDGRLIVQFVDGTVTQLEADWLRRGHTLGPGESIFGVFGDVDPPSLNAIAVKIDLHVAEPQFQKKAIQFEFLVNQSDITFEATPDRPPVQPQDDESLMKTLTDATATGKPTREAALSLARVSKVRRLGTGVWRRAGPGAKPHPAVAKFADPTAAEAILSAMDRDLKAHDENEHNRSQDYRRRQIEDIYLFSLIELGDGRLAAELARRAGEELTPRMRRKWAYACYCLGDPVPLDAFARDFRNGTLRLPANNEPETNDFDQPGNVELRGVVAYLSAVTTEESERALNSLADPSNPYHAYVKQHVLSDHIYQSEKAPWFDQRFCLSILRRTLDDTTPTGVKIAIKEGTLIDSYVHTAPDYLHDGDLRDWAVPERRCDIAGERLSDLVAGLPRYHPLFVDADERLRSLKATFDRVGANCRTTSEKEKRILASYGSAPRFIPHIYLDLVATPEDFESGKAIFHQDGKGKVADFILPAIAVRKGDEKKRNPPRLLIVQAEIGPDGKVLCGVIGRNTMAAVPAADLTGLQ